MKKSYDDHDVKEVEVENCGDCPLHNPRGTPLCKHPSAYKEIKTQKDTIPKACPLRGMALLIRMKV